MQFVRMIGLLSCLGTLAGAAIAAGAEPSPAGLPRSTPSEQGVDARGLLGFVEALDRKVDGMHGVVVVRHGKVVAEGWWRPYAAETPHALYSLSKSFTSTAVGLAIAEGKLRLDDPVLKFFPADAPSDPSKNLRSMRVADLLRMSTGHQAEPKVGPNDKDPWTKTFLAQAVPHKPGTHFLYNTPATYMLSAIVQQVTGQTVLDYLRPRLFDPLGIKDPAWGTSPQGVSLGGYGLSIRTEDIARFGQLYLQKGKWQGQQLVPEAWVEAATARQTSNGSDPNTDWDQGYGYQFWRCRHDAFRGDGAFGQYCVVIPEQDTVVAINSGVRDMQGVLNVVWDHLLPALQPSPLPAADPALMAQLTEKLAHLGLARPEGKPTTDLAGQVAGKRFAFPTNPVKVEAATYQAASADATAALIHKVTGRDVPVPAEFAQLQRGKPGSLVLKVAGKDVAIPADGDWHPVRAAFGPLDEQTASACATWTADDTLTARIAFVETPFVATAKLKFAADEVKMDAESNVGFGATRMPTVTGKPE